MFKSTAQTDSDLIIFNGDHKQLMANPGINSCINHHESLHALVMRQ